MRISGQCISGLIAAALLAPAAAPQTPAAPGPMPISPTVNLRLSPDLGDALPEVRAALLGLPSLRIAEPAFYEITTKRDFPQTLVAIDALQSQSEWQNDFKSVPVRPAPRTIELGNLALDDFSGRLRLLVDRRDRANQLLAAGLAQQKAPGPRLRVETCVLPDGGDVTFENCHQGRIRDDPNIGGLSDWLDGETFFQGRIHNRSAIPRYVALLLIDPWLGITRVPAKDGADKVPLAPGQKMDTDLLDFGYSSGTITLLTVTSDRPIDTSAIEQSPVDDSAWDDCLKFPAGCARPASSIPVDWSISLAEYHYQAPTLVGIGGGFDVTEGMAPWMVEIYSTVPFKPDEIAADSLLPDTDKDKKHLAQRSQQERDHRCGGTLIGPRLVLTAAHCVANAPFSPATMAKVLTDRRVRVDTKRLGRGGTTLAIAGVAIPTSYTPGRQQDDIALLLIKPDRDTKRYAEAAARMGDKPIAAGTDVTAFGWGYTGTVAPGANPLLNIAEELQRNPDQLQFGRMRTLAWNTCRKRLKSRLGSGMVCVVAPGAETGAAPDKNVFSCRGDSGGPLIREFNGVEELVGVTSWSLGCGYKDYPSVYTDVTKYRQWIAAASQQLKPGFAQPVDERAAPSRQEGRRQ